MCHCLSLCASADRVELATPGLVNHQVNSESVEGFSMFNLKADEQMSEQDPEPLFNHITCDIHLTYTHFNSCHVMVKFMLQKRVLFTTKSCFFNRKNISLYILWACVCVCVFIYIWIHKRSLYFNMYKCIIHNMLIHFIELKRFILNVRLFFLF